MVSTDIEHLIGLLAKLPGLGPRSARRAVLYLIKRRESLGTPLIKAMADAIDNIKTCSECGNLDTTDPCRLCADPERDRSVICVVEDVADLWALERARVFKGRYHVLGGILSALDGLGPDDLNLPGLIECAGNCGVKEVILATSATLDRQPMPHYHADRLAVTYFIVLVLAPGVPVGG